ncbi:MAG: DUF4194 domain-containing protein [Coriobacteriales bacterium]|jgi:hypothetical protein|nr:DUF4194 domain-containing protein [Coriobacteriales bacterium]
MNNYDFKTFNNNAKKNSDPANFESLASHSAGSSASFSAQSSAGSSTQSLASHSAGSSVDFPADSFAGKQWQPDTSERYWPADTGTLPFDARRALVALIRGPMLTAEKKELWQALQNNQEAIQSRLADLFLDLILDSDSGIAFVRNAEAEDGRVPKTVKSQRLSLVDTIMVLTLRKELLLDNSERVFVGREDLTRQLSHYRPVTKMDESAFKKRVETSWSRLVKAGLLQATETEERCEISPVLKLIFGVEEVKAIEGVIQSALTGKSALTTRTEDFSLLAEFEETDQTDLNEEQLHESDEY